MTSDAPARISSPYDAGRMVVEAGDRARALRKKSRLSAVAFSRLLSQAGWRLDETQISRFERAERAISLEQLIAICDALDTDPTALLGREPKGAQALMPALARLQALIGPDRAIEIANSLIATHVLVVEAFLERRGGTRAGSRASNKKKGASRARGTRG